MARRWLLSLVLFFSASFFCEDLQANGPGGPPSPSRSGVSGLKLTAASAGFVHLGVPRNSVHPNLAKLFINVMMSAEGQRTLYKVYSADHYALPGSQSWAEMTDLRARGTKIFDIDAKFAVEHPEMSQRSRELQDLLTKKGP